jgi:hypothetical protein
MMPGLVSGSHRLLHAPRAAVRQRAAAAVVADRPPSGQVLVVAPSLEAGSRVLRRAVEGRPAAFGHQRATPGELAARLAAGPLAAAGRAQVAPVALEAICARMVHERSEAGALGRYARVGDRPGLPRALARTFLELGLARVAPDHPELPPDLARLYAAYRRELSAAGLADRAAVLEAALARLADPAPHPLLDLPLVLFDVALPSALDGALVEALARRASVVAVVPSGDRTALRRLERALGVAPEPIAASDAAHDGSAARGGGAYDGSAARGDAPERTAAGGGAAYDGSAAGGGGAYDGSAAGGGGAYDGSAARGDAPERAAAGCGAAHDASAGAARGDAPERTAAGGGAAHDGSAARGDAPERTAAGGGAAYDGSAARGDAGTALERLGAQLFGDVARRAPLDDTVELFSAPGESRECVEIARRVLQAAAEGVPFDRMAVLTHAPERYRAHLVEALRRAGIPAHFSRGTKRPDPAGRALLALLECKVEGLGARAFAEYLSLGVVPDAGEDGAPPPADGRVPWLPPEDEMVAASAGQAAWPDEGAAAGAAVDGDGVVRDGVVRDGVVRDGVVRDGVPRDGVAVDPVAGDGAAADALGGEAAANALGGAAGGGPVVAGTLRAPWRWERLIVDAAVIGGAGRWRRRLDGLARGVEHELAALEDPDDPRRRTLERRRADLSHLRAFALPLLEALDALPEQATWGEWIERLSRLAERAIRGPARVLAVLRELAPMAPIGPVGLTEVQLVLTRRLTEMTSRPAAAPAGKLYVASTEEARGLTFARVFVPGLAERVFPKKVTEDPVALDAVRARVSDELATTETRVEQERLALRLAIGAAEERLSLSYPRLDTERGRPRVPSFYGLEILRAIEGALPSFQQLASRAEAAGAARMAWPAPDDPDEAIDPAEYDLAVLGRVLAAPDPRDAQGAARYLVEANPHLARALRARFARWHERWTQADGLVNPSERALEALRAHGLDRRAYSATALEQLAACPYRFYLRAIVGLSPREEPEAAEALDPLARGNLIHAIQFACLARLRDEGLLPVTEASLERAQAVLDAAVDEVAARFAEELAPAIDRVWEDAVADVRTDLTEWLLRASERPDWVPTAFELAFGLPKAEGRDPASVEEPVRLAEGLSLRGAIDLVEQREGALRATDHKTGAAPGRVGLIGGGKVLQPLLYARALEAIFPDREVVGGRLYYCTSRGRFEERHVPLTPEARESVEVLVEVVGKMLEKGFLPAAPDEGECARCDYRAVCGPAEERRVKRKDVRYLGPLRKLRKRP